MMLTYRLGRIGNKKQVVKMEAKTLYQFFYIRIYGCHFDALAFAEFQKDASDEAKGEAYAQRPHTWCSPKRIVSTSGLETIEEHAYQAMMCYEKKIQGAWKLGAEFVVLQFVFELADINFLRGLHLMPELIKLANEMRADIDIDYIWQG